MTNWNLIRNWDFLNNKAIYLLRMTHYARLMMQRGEEKGFRNEILYYLRYIVDVWLRVYYECDFYVCFVSGLCVCFSIVCVFEWIRVYLWVYLWLFTRHILTAPWSTAISERQWLLTSMQDFSFPRKVWRHRTEDFFQD